MRICACAFVAATITLLFDHASSLAVTGVVAKVDSATGERPIRQNINQLEHSGPHWDLYILALRDLQRTSSDDPLSYQQIAGIHGLPSIPWDDVERASEATGYCVHGAVTFPSWHRPYLALFEQALWAHAQRIAQRYSIKQQPAYIEAALELRIPYWDAFADAALPPAVTKATVEVQTPEGIETVDNPLYNYTFQGVENVTPFPAGHWGAEFASTVRHWDTSTQKSDLDQVASAFSNQRQNLQENTWRLFATETNYTRMSTASFRGPSLEHIHNLVHGVVGGSGHMSDTATSAFDPIFWLHHANVDRIFAMWQAVNPGSWLVPTANPTGTFALPRGTIESGDSPLRPFHNDNGTSFWTSDIARSTRALGYTYPELLDWKMSGRELADHVRSRVNQLYGDEPEQSGPIRRRRRKRPGKQPHRGVQDASAGRDLSASLRQAHWQWTVTLQMQRMAYTASFFLDFFDGVPPDEPEQWATAKNLIGSHVQFISSVSPGMAQKDNVDDDLTYGEVPLNAFLHSQMRSGALDDLEPESVIPFLTETLTWRARDMAGHAIALESLGSLSVAVGSQIMQPRWRTDGFPHFSRLSLHRNITTDKPSGLQVPDWDFGVE